MRRWMLVGCCALVGVLCVSGSVQATPSGFVVFQPANLHGASAVFSSVTAPRPKTAFIAGHLTLAGASQALLEAWNGTAWTRVSLSLPVAATSSILVSVSSPSPSDGWAVGWYQTQAAGSQPVTHALAYQKTASGWHRVTVSVPSYDIQDIYSVSDSYSRDVWALADDPAGCTIDILHYTGAWTVTGTVDQCDGDSNATYTKITDVGTNTAWVVGTFERSGESAGGVASCNGSVCPSLPEHDLDGADAVWFDAASRGDAADVWLVGQQDTETPVTDHWNGSTWTSYPSSFGYTTSHQVTSAAELVGGVVWMVGWRATAAGDRTLILEHTPTGWHDLGGPNVGTASNRLVSVAHVIGTASGMWAVGSDGDAPLLLHHSQ